MPHLLQAGTAALVLALPGTASAQDGTAALAWAPAWWTQVLHAVAWSIEAAGVLVIVAGALLAAGRYARKVAREGASSEAYHALRADLGRGILLGLELLVAADIIGTVAVEPTLHNLAVLAIIVLIRTFLSFALEVEIQGHWPWQHSRLAGGAKVPSRQAGA